MSTKETILEKIKPNEDELNLKDNVIFISLILLIMAIMIIMPYFVTGNLIDSHIQADALKLRQLAPEDLYVKRSFEYIDKKATEEKKEAALSKVYPIFTFDVSNTFNTSRRILNFNISIENDNLPGILDLLVSASPNEKELFVKGYEELSLVEKRVLSSWVYDVSKYVLQSGYYDKNEIISLKADNVNKLTLKGYLNDMYSVEKLEETKKVAVDSLITTGNLEDIIESYLDSNNSDGLNSNSARLLVLSVKGLLAPNVHYDYLLTELAKDEAISDIEDIIVTVPSGQRILSKDTIITQSDIELLKQVEDNSAIYSNTQIIARIILIVLITVFSLYLFWTRAAYTFRRVQFTYIYLILMIFTLLLSLLINYYASKLNISVLAPCLPVLFGTLLLKNVTGKKRFAILFTIQYALYSTLFPGATFFTFFYLMAIGITFLYIIVYDQSRMTRIGSIFKGGLIAILMTLVLYAIEGYPFNKLLYSFSFILINILFCYMLERLLLPLIDSFLNIPTIFRLEELRDINQKLITKLKMSAQGTYNHSINVSDLAYEAAKKIGADAELCRVAALYHDIGKLDHPEYFTENQEDGVNKHDELSPSMSGSIIRSHVKLGVDMCKAEGLPKEIVDIVSEHHGNDLIQYFYQEAKKFSSDKPFNKVVPSDYCYTGNPPRSKESAIVMIADSVEAASHSQKVSAQKVGRLISMIVKQKLDRGQLNDSNLTLSELKLIEQSLENSLVGKLHTRIKYPKDDEKRDNKE